MAARAHGERSRVVRAMGMLSCLAAAKTNLVARPTACHMIFSISSKPPHCACVTATTYPPHGAHKAGLKRTRLSKRLSAYHGRERALANAKHEQHHGWQEHCLRAQRQRAQMQMGGSRAAYMMTHATPQRSGPEARRPLASAFSVGSALARKLRSVERVPVAKPQPGRITLQLSDGFSFARGA